MIFNNLIGNLYSLEVIDKNGNKTRLKLNVMYEIREDEKGKQEGCARYKFALLT